MPPGLPQNLMFLAFALAFAIKVPLFPFHTWLPDAHVEAPTAGQRDPGRRPARRWGRTASCASACRSSRTRASRSGRWSCALAVIGIVYGAWVSTVQPDMKKLVAYSSVSHLGFVHARHLHAQPAGRWWAASSRWSTTGCRPGALFLMVGMIYERRHTRLIADFGGLWTRRCPRFSALFLVVVLSSLGLPGLNGFVGEFLILVGAFQVGARGSPPCADQRHHLRGGLPALDVPARDLRRGHPRGEPRAARPRPPREWAVLVPVVVLIVWIGVYPAAFTGKTGGDDRGADRPGGGEGRR